MLGPIVDSMALALGGVLGASFGSLLPQRIKDTLPLIFGVITISIGLPLVGKASQLPVVVMSLILGAFFGELIHIEAKLENILRNVFRWSKKHDEVDNAFILQYVTLISAFCFGSMGFFGAFNEGITGNPEILITKAVLDIFSGLIFGASMGIAVSLIAIPQFIILATLFLSAQVLLPMITDTMLNDFTSCGGVIFLATGLRMCNIKVFPVINMMPALVVVFFLSSWWQDLSQLFL